MSAYGDNPEVHRITDHRFVCTAPEDAPCRTLPTCDCDIWCGCDGSAEDVADTHDLDDGEHCCMQLVQPGQSCWIESWLDDDIADCYHPEHGWGLDASDFPDGPVLVDWDGDCCTWEYADDTRPAAP